MTLLKNNKSDHPPLLKKSSNYPFYSAWMSHLSSGPQGPVIQSFCSPLFLLSCALCGLPKHMLTSRYLPLLVPRLNVVPSVCSHRSIPYFPHNVLNTINTFLVRLSLTYPLHLFDLCLQVKYVCVCVYIYIYIYNIAHVIYSLIWSTYVPLKDRRFMGAGLFLFFVCFFFYISLVPKIVSGF